jgi:ADP-ribose pyrophosphatase YjhB (NUDIX family)
VTIRFCTACGGPTASRIPDGDDHARQVCDRCGEVHYVNPKVVVGAVCALGDRVLLCRRAIDPRRGYWTIPAGYMELDETVEEGAVREAREEAGAEIEIQGLLACYSLKRIDQVQLLFAAALRRPEVEAGPESLEVALVRWADIPWDELAFPTVHWVLETAYRRGLAVPERRLELADPARGPER